MKKNKKYIFLTGIISVLVIFLLPSVSKAIECETSCGMGAPSGMTPICTWGSPGTSGVTRLGIMETLCSWPNHCKCEGDCSLSSFGNCLSVGASCRQMGFSSGTNGQSCTAMNGCYNFPSCHDVFRTGYWDASEAHCVTCNSVKAEQYVLGDATAIYTGCGSSENGNTGDGLCESACGANSHIDELMPGVCSAWCDNGNARRLDCADTSCNFYDGVCVSICGADVACELKNPGESCGISGTGTCQNDCTCYIPPSGCTIPGVGTVANGACNSVNKCQYCDISKSTTAWSSVPSGQVCVSNSLVSVSATNYCNYGEDCSIGDCSAQKWWTSCNGAGACRSASTSPPTDSYIEAVTASNGYVLKSDCSQTTVSSSYHCGESEDCSNLASSCDGWVFYKGCSSGSCSNLVTYGFNDTADDSPCDDKECSTTDYCGSCILYTGKRCSSGSCTLGIIDRNCNPYSCSGVSCSGTCSKTCGAGCESDLDCPGSSCNLATCACVGADITPPTFSNYKANTTTVGAPVNFSVVITDNVALSGYIFETNNTGTWVNYTWTALSSGGTAYNITTLNSIAGSVINVSFYANDSSNNWAVYRASLNTGGAGVIINPPQVETIPINIKGTIGESKATIWGELTYMGGASSCLVWFEYKKITDTTWTKACEKTMTSTDFFSCDLTGLTSTTYYFKAFAENGGSW